MNKPSQKTELLVWGGLVLIIATITGAFILSELSANKQLPIINQLSDFHLTNQNNQPVSLADLRGKVWVANIIFTRCPGPCPVLTHQVAEIQSLLPFDGPVRLVSFTSDPENDTPVVLKEYATKFSADSNRWFFLTGPRQDIRSLAVNDFKFVLLDKKPAEREVPNDLFIHSTWMMLVDQQGRVRGWTDKDGSLHAYFEPGTPEMPGRILDAIKQLLSEKQP